MLSLPPFTVRRLRRQDLPGVVALGSGVWVWVSRAHWPPQGSAPFSLPAPGHRAARRVRLCSASHATGAAGVSGMGPVGLCVERRTCDLRSLREGATPHSEAPGGPKGGEGHGWAQGTVWDWLVAGLLADARTRGCALWSRAWVGTARWAVTGVQQ